MDDPPSLPDPTEFLRKNSEWRKKVLKDNPNFFKDSAEKQRPTILWIGCSDSRVPASVVTASMPGNIFVHCNIANQFHEDNNINDHVRSALHFAMKSLGVRHVIVVGHTRCGGVAKAYELSCSPPLPPLSSLQRWLYPLIELAQSIDLPSEKDKAIKKLTTESIKLQMANIAAAPVLKEIEEELDTKITIHGWLYQLENGELSESCKPITRNLGSALSDATV